MRMKTISVTGPKCVDIQSELDNKVLTYLSSIGSPGANRVQTSLAQSEETVISENLELPVRMLTLTMSILVFEQP